MTEKEMRETNCVILRTMRLHHMLCEKNLEKLRLHRAQHRLLVLLAQGALASQKELAERLEISPAAVAVSLKKLENDGYIERSAAESDSRFNHVLITKKGRHVLEESHNSFYRLDLAMYNGISEEEAATLSRIMKKISGNLENALNGQSDV